MEWVETTARTVEEAKDLALDQLGVDEADAEFEVLDEPRPGLFGRMRGEARVRARVRPTAPRPKADRRDRKRRRPERSDGPKEAAVEVDDVPAEEEEAPRTHRVDEVDDSGEPPEVPIALDFLTGLAEALGSEAQATWTQDAEGGLEFQLDGGDLGLLIGPRGQTLSAVQDLTRILIARRLPERDVRIHVDVGGYRQRRREALDRFARQVADEVIRTGERKVLEPMSRADRKVVHDSIGTIAGVVTHSEGEEPFRRIVIAPE